MASVSSPKRGSNIECREQTKRLTMVEKARLEALAVFGNQGFDTLPVRKDDFRTKLQTSTAKSGNTLQPRAMTRLERAKLEANSAFKDIKLGQNTAKKRKLQETNCENADPKRHTLTRLQKAKEEANKAFENVSLSTIPKKRSKLEQEQLLHKKSSKEVQKVDWDSPRQKRIGEKYPSDEPTKQITTRSQRSKGKPLKSYDLHGVKTKTQLPSVTAETTLNVTTTTPNTTEMTRIATKATPNTTTLIPSITETPPNHTSQIEATEDTNTPQESNENKEKHIPEDAKEEPRKLSRIEKAQLEAIESFKGQHLDEICKESKKIVAKYFKPKKVKAQNTQATTQDTPLAPSHKNKSGNQSFSNVYSSIHDKDNLNDHTILLETSKRVVETAKSLETPEGSPACH